MSTKGIVAIVPHPAGDVEALDTTLQALHRGGPLHRINGEVWTDVAGTVYAHVEDPEFVSFAVKNQGYAKDAFDVTGVVKLPEEVT